MDRKAILLKNPADWTEEEQVYIIDETDNSLTAKDDPKNQPDQDPNWKPDPNEVIEVLDG